MDLHRKYRPKTFEDVVGQSHAVPAIKRALEKKLSHIFLLMGPTGTGKTTLARLIAKSVGAADHAVFEFNAASSNGIDDARAVAEISRAGALGSDARVIVLDECHGYSKAAWSSLLKPLEEPPEDCYFILCTTELEKVRADIRGRCTEILLKPVQAESIAGVLKKIVKKEGFTTSDKVVSFIASACNGSVRRGITLLAKCTDVTSVDAAKDIVGAIDVDPENANHPVIMLCRDLLNSSTGHAKFMQCRQYLKQMVEQNISSETARCILTAYFEKCMLNMPPVQATKCLNILQSFATPYYNQSGITPFALSLADYLLSD